MPLFTSAERAQAQADIQSEFLTENCNIYRVDSATTGAFGEPTMATINVALNIPCRLIRRAPALSPSQMSDARQETMKEIYRIVLPAGQTVDIDYQIVLNDIFYDVVDIQDALTDELFVQALVTRRRGA